MDIIKDIIAIAEPTTAGQKLLTVAIQFEKEIVGSELTLATFAVRNRTVIDIYTAIEPSHAAKAKNGRFVILKLSPDDEDALTFWREKHIGPPPKPEEMLKLPPKKIIRNAIRVEVAILHPLICVDGSTIPDEAAWHTNNKERQLVVEDFSYHIFNDENNGKDMMYSLFTPTEHEGEKMPLVVFLGDGSTCSDERDWSLICCDGGTVWAESTFQKDNPCYVLVPQISKASGLIVNDDYEGSQDLDTVLRLIEMIIDKYSVDKTRVYVTGQSMGCMTFCELNCRRPDMFAASLLVAGHWNAKRMAEQCINKNLWIFVSEGDSKAIAGMNCVADAMKSAGANIIRKYFDGQWSTDKLNAEVEKISQGDGVRYSVFKQGTMFPKDYKGSRYGGDHFETWRKVYHIDALKRWLFRQTLDI